MIIISLVDNTEYILLEGEYLTYGNVGVYVWDKGKDEGGFDIYPPKKFYVYGYVKKVEKI